MFKNALTLWRSRPIFDKISQISHSNLNKSRVKRFTLSEEVNSAHKHVITPWWRYQFQHPGTAKIRYSNNARFFVFLGLNIKATLVLQTCCSILGHITISNMAIILHLYFPQEHCLCFKSEVVEAFQRLSNRNVCLHTMNDLTQHTNIWIAIWGHH